MHLYNRSQFLNCIICRFSSGTSSSLSLWPKNSSAPWLLKGPLILLQCIRFTLSRSFFVRSQHLFPIRSPWLFIARGPVRGWVQTGCSQMTWFTLKGDWSHFQQEAAVKFSFLELCPPTYRHFGLITVAVVFHLNFTSAALVVSPRVLLFIIITLSIPPTRSSSSSIQPLCSRLQSQWDQPVSFCILSCGSTPALICSRDTQWNGKRAG